MKQMRLPSFNVSLLPYIPSGPREWGTIHEFAPLMTEVAHLTEPVMIRKLTSGEYRLYSRKINPKTGRRRNLGTFKTRAEAQKHERAVQYFKRVG
jgi:hypothetical protein